MSVLAIDIGGTKVAFGLFSVAGDVISVETLLLGARNGSEAGQLITGKVNEILDANMSSIKAIGVSVPGIYRSKTGTVWAPNIPGWDNYPLMSELQQVASGIPVAIDSDRSCYILGEIWKGNAKNCSDAIFLAVGTGIGAGIVANNTVISGSNGIAGAIGWLALSSPFDTKYRTCGCFEHHASGEGIAKIAREHLKVKPDYRGVLLTKAPEEITTQDVFAAYAVNDEVAMQVIRECIIYWGMAVANLVSLFNPEKIIFGGGVFGPAIQFLPQIKEEAAKWAQPISIMQVTLEPSGLGNDAGVYGAGYLALQSIQSSKISSHV